MVQQDKWWNAKETCFLCEFENAIVQVLRLPHVRVRTTLHPLIFKVLNRNLKKIKRFETLSVSKNYPEVKNHKTSLKI